MILTRKIAMLSEGDFYYENITDQVKEIVQESGIQEGIAFVYYRHTTGAVIIVEHEAGILVDLEDILEGVIPQAADYTHHIRGYDTNGAAHLQSILLGVSVQVPILEGKLHLGTYQEILAIDMDSARKERQLIVQIMGE